MLLNVVNKRAGEPQKLIVLLTIIIGAKNSKTHNSMDFKTRTFGRRKRKHQKRNQNRTWKPKRKNPRSYWNKSNHRRSPCLFHNRFNAWLNIWKWRRIKNLLKTPGTRCNCRRQSKTVRSFARVPGFWSIIPPVFTGTSGFLEEKNAQRLFPLVSEVRFCSWFRRRSL